MKLTVFMYRNLTTKANELGYRGKSRHKGVAVWNASQFCQGCFARVDGEIPYTSWSEGLLAGWHWMDEQLSIIRRQGEGLE